MFSGSGSAPGQSQENNRLWNFAFFTIGALTFLLFVRWGLDYVGADAHIPIFLISALFGLFMAFNIGGNDVANSFGTSVGSGTLTIKQALLVAAIFEVSGAVIAGGEVTDTVRSGIVDLGSVSGSPRDFMFIMMAALFAAAVWLLFATKMGYPVSTTHSIIGGIVGASIMLGVVTHQSHPFAMVQWGEVGKIAMSWVLSPTLGGVVSYFLYKWVKHTILGYNEKVIDHLADIDEERARRRKGPSSADRVGEIQRVAGTSDSLTYSDDDDDDDFDGLKFFEDKIKSVNAYGALMRWVPLLAAFGAIVLVSMVIFKGLKNLNFELSTTMSLIILALVGIAAWTGVRAYAQALRGRPLPEATFVLFSWMQVFTACGFAFSHGSNDIANAIGPFVAILDVLRTGTVGEESVVPTPALLAFGIALIVGLWFIGKAVIKTVGTNLTEIHPASGFSAELAAAMVVMGASVLGLPVSSTHILIGAVLGIGMVNHSTNWKLMKPIGLAWVITLPAAATMAALSLLVLRAIF